MLQFHSLVNETDPTMSGGMEPGGVEEPIEEPGWGGPSQEDWEQLQQQNEAMLGYIQQQVQAQEQNGQPQLDPLADDFQQRLDQYIAEKTQPYQQFTEEYQNKNAEELAWDMVASAESQEGEFLLRETTDELPVSSQHMARALAEDLLPEFQERYGSNSMKAIEGAIGQAVKYVRAYEDAIGQAYEQRKQNELQTRLSAPMTPAANGVAAQSFDSGASNEMDLVAKYTGGVR